MRGANREKGIRALAWISYVFAVVGGAAITDTGVGHTITAVVAWLPAWAATLACVGGAVAMAVDLLVDGIPNRLAVWLGILLPSVAAAVPGKLSTTVVDLSGKMLTAVSGGMRTWLGTSSALGLALGAVAISLLVARRVIVKTGMR